MCRYDDLQELKIWEELIVNYQAELEMRINMERNAFLIEHTQLQIDTLKKKLEMNKQDELLRTTPSYDMASQVFENQNANWKSDSDKSQEFRNICKGNFITGYLAAKNEGEGVSMELYQKLHNEAQKNYDKARKLQETIMVHLHKNYCVQIFCVTTDGTFLNSLDWKVVSKKNEVITDLEKHIIQELGEEYNPQLYQVVTETLYAFKNILISKIK